MRSLVARTAAAGAVAVAATFMAGGVASAAPAAPAAAPAPSIPSIYLIPGVDLGPVLAPTVVIPQAAIGALLPLFPAG